MRNANDVKYSRMVLRRKMDVGESEDKWNTKNKKKYTFEAESWFDSQTRPDVLDDHGRGGKYINVYTNSKTAYLSIDRFQLSRHKSYETRP